MSAATAEAAEGAPKGKKKLIIIVAAVLALAGGGGGAAAFMMKKKAAEAAEAAAAAADDEDGEEDAAPAHSKKKDSGHAVAPTFVTLDPFVVNLADKDVDRFAQIGITLEVESAKTGDDLKAYMPAIRNGILMVLSHKTSQEMLSREGKELLAQEVLRESMLPLGLDISEDGGKKKRKKSSEDQPVKHVYFSNFIVQ